MSIMSICPHTSCREKESLGSGAFGIVYRGVWSHHEAADSDQMVTEEVAVKTMEGGASEEDRVKFLQEAAIMGQFSHPNIVKILGVIVEQNEVKQSSSV
jgi:serine/threonine protein kinase